MSKTKTVPTKALTWQSSFELRDNGEDAKSAPFKMTARSGGPVNHWFFGRVVHDLEGMRHKDKVAIDYNHNNDEVIGYANHFNIENGDLEVSGALIPHGDNDRTAEVIHKQKAGVPYEASIFFTDPLLEEVPEGTSVDVNGREFSGPGVVVREWTLRGIAVCPYGQDPNTQTAFNQSETTEVQVMPTHENTKEVENNDVAEVTNETVEAPVDNGVAESPADVEANSDDSQESAEPELAGAMSEGQKFLDAFGDQGGVWFAQGKSFEEAQQLFTQTILDENKALKDELAAFKNVGGESDAVEFSATDQEAEGRKKSFMSIFDNK